MVDFIENLKGEVIASLPHFMAIDHKQAKMKGVSRNKTIVAMLTCWCSSGLNLSNMKWLVTYLVFSWSVENYKVEGFSPLWDSVKTQVFQEYEIISSRGQISVVRAKLGEDSKPDLIVGENVKLNSRLILTCTAWYPSEWVYSGDADPTYTSNTTIENLGTNGNVLPLDDVNGAKRYVATIVIGPRGVKSSDTGRYNCMTASPETGMKFKTLSAFYHLFVPGKTLFIRKRGGTILYDLHKSPARIPCGVTNPKVAVSLQKFQNGNLVNVNVEDVLWHPISGFYPRERIPGVYVCTAAHNKAFELLHFTLVPKISDSATIQSIKQSSEEDLDWLFNSFKLGHSNRIHLSTRPPAGYGSSNKQKLQRPRPTLSASYGSGQKQSSEFHNPTSIWKRPSAEDHDDAVVKSPGASNNPSTYRPVYVLFAEDLNRIKAKTTERPSGSFSGSGSASASASASEETEEEGEEEDREDQEKETDAEEAESREEEEKEKNTNTDNDNDQQHQYHFDGQALSADDSQLILQQLFSTQRPTTTQRPKFHREYATTYLPFINFLNPSSAVVKYKPVVNPAESIIKYSDSRRTTTSRPAGQIVYDLQLNKLVYRESGFTRPDTERPTRPTQRPSRFKIPSLPTQRWPTTRRSTRKPPTSRISTTSTTPAPPLIPDAVVCVNNPCGKHATCYANTVYYHKQKETRREPACKCIDNYHGNPYLECSPPSPVEQNFLSFNSSFEKRTGMESVVSLEEGYLQNSDVFPHSSDEPIIVDAKKK